MKTTVEHFERVTLPVKTVKAIFDPIQNSLDVFDLRNRPLLIHSVFSIALEDPEGITVHLTPSGLNSRVRVKRRDGYETTFSPKNADLPEVALRLRPTGDRQAVSIQIGLRNTTGRPLKVREFNLICVDCLMSGRVVPHLSLGNMVFYGYRSLLNDPFPHWIEPERMLYGSQHFQASSVALLADKVDKSALVLGFVTAHNWEQKISMRLKDFSYGIQRLRAVNSIEGVQIDPGECIRSETLTVEHARAAADGLENWAARTAADMGATPPPESPSGWATWDYYHCDINEEKILENVRYLARNRDRFPVKYIQIDDGYCPYGDWLDWDKKRFPHGPAWLVEKIKSYGFSPAIWYIPTVIASNSQFVKKHPDFLKWVLKDDRGEPVVRVKTVRTGRVMENRTYYFLDGSLPEAQRIMRDTAAALTGGLGFEYVKTDGATAHVMTGGRTANDRVGLHRAHRVVRRCVREGTQGAFLLACLHDPCYAGLVDGLRVGPDIRAIWDINYWPQKYPEYAPGAAPFMEHVLGNMLNSWFTHRRLWINDPDYLVIRNGGGWKNPGKVRFFSTDEARFWASLVSLYGGIVMLGDRMATLPEERKRILEKVLPARPLRLRPLDFLEGRIPSVLVSDAGNRTGRWRLLVFLNYTAGMRSLSAPLKSIGVSGQAHAFDFWSRCYVPVTGGAILSGPMRPHSIRCLAVRPRVSHPQVVGSDIHITQGAVEILSERWNPRAKTLTITLDRQLKRRGTIFVFVPGSFACIAATGRSKRYGHGSVKELAVDTRKTPEIVLRFRTDKPKRFQRPLR